MPDEEAIAVATHYRMSHKTDKWNELSFKIDGPILQRRLGPDLIKRLIWYKEKINIRNRRTLEGMMRSVEEGRAEIVDFKDRKKPKPHVLKLAKYEQNQ